MASTAVEHCVNHRRKAKVATCGTCGNGLCADCVVHTPVGMKCRTCTGVRGGGVASGAHVTVGAPTHRAEAAPGGGGAERGRRWPVALVAAGVAVVAVAGYAVVSRSSSSKTADEPVVALVGPVVTERVSEFVGAGGLRLGGTLTLPAASTTPPTTQGGVPAVLLVPGLGAVDRDGVSAAGTPDATRDALAASLTMSALGGTEPMFKDLSMALADAGIASFRYDKRGTVASKLPAGQKLSFDDEVADAKAALTFLTQRQEVGSAGIGIIGQDQGGLVAMRVAAGNPRVRALITISTPARPLADVLAGDLTRTRGSATGDEFRAAVATLTGSGKVPAQSALSTFLQPLFPAGQEPYLTSILSLDPVTEAAAVKVPSLVVRGGGDLSVTAADADRLAAALPQGTAVLTGADDTDRNLALPGPGHVHSNTVTAPTSNQDAEAVRRLGVWLSKALHT